VSSSRGAASDFNPVFGAAKRCGSIDHQRRGDDRLGHGDKFIRRVGRPKDSGTKELVRCGWTGPCSTISVPEGQAGKPVSTMPWRPSFGRGVTGKISRTGQNAKRLGLSG